MTYLYTFRSLASMPVVTALQNMLLIKLVRLLDLCFFDFFPVLM